MYNFTERCSKNQDHGIPVIPFNSVWNNYILNYFDGVFKIKSSPTPKLMPCTSMRLFTSTIAKHRKKKFISNDIIDARHSSYLPCVDVFITDKRNAEDTKKAASQIGINKKIFSKVSDFIDSIK